MNNYKRRITDVLCASLLTCGVVSAEEGKSTPDPLFDQEGFDFHTYTASYDPRARPAIATLGV